MPGYRWGQKKSFNFLQMELHLVVKRHFGTGKWAQVLCKNIRTKNQWTVCSSLYSSLKSFLGWLHNLTFVESTTINMDVSRGFLQCQTHYCHMQNPSLIIPFHCPPKQNLLNSSENLVLFPITDINMKFFKGTKNDTVSHLFFFSHQCLSVVAQKHKAYYRAVKNHF